MQNYNASLEQTEGVASRVGSAVTSQFSKVQSSFERLTTRLKNMIFRFVVMRALYAAFNSIKNLMSAMVKQSDTFGTSLNRLKSTALVAFYPVLDRMSQQLERLVVNLTNAVAWIGNLIHAWTGADINDSIKNAEKLYNAMNQDANEKNEKKAIDARIKAKQKEIKEIDKQQKALKRQYDHEKESIEDKKRALDEEIDAVNRTIKALRRQEDAEKALAKSLKDSIQAQIDALNDRKKARKSELDEERKAVDNQLKALDKEIKALEKQKKLREEWILGLKNKSRVWIPPLSSPASRCRP